MHGPADQLESATPIGPPPPFDEELAVTLAALAPLVPPAITAEMIPERRRGNPAMPPVSDDELARHGAFRVETRHAPARLGGEVALVACRPTDATAPVPVLYYLHGGGMIFGDARSGLDAMVELAEPLGCCVVAVEYRLAPEHPHPYPVEDCYDGLTWTLEHAGELGIDPERVVVAGVSAGGGLAAALCLLARDRGGPRLAGQLLICPMLDDRNDSPSARQMEGLGVWDRTANHTAWSAVLGEARATPRVSPYAAPARASDLSGLPPAYLDVGSAETFRDEDVAYASRIWQAGGRAELHVWPGGFHNFEAFAPQARLSIEARLAKRRWLERLLDAEPSRDANSARARDERERGARA